jgi:hypothetical protein
MANTIGGPAAVGVAPPAGLATADQADARKTAVATEVAVTRERMFTDTPLLMINGSLRSRPRVLAGGWLRPAGIHCGRRPTPNRAPWRVFDHVIKPLSTPLIV